MEMWMRILIVACLSVTAMASIVHVILVGKRIGESKEIAQKKISEYTTGDYNADVRCDICFDDIGDEMVSQCRCGKTFHLTCAEPTGNCPYCGADFKDFLPARPARHVTCPRCGNVMHGNICECGTILPDPDYTFECRCGERISVKKGNVQSMCRRCGRLFDSKVMRVKKEFIPNR